MIKNGLILISLCTLFYHVYFSKTLKTVRTIEQTLPVEMHNYSINKTVSVKADDFQVGHQYLIVWVPNSVLGLVFGNCCQYCGAMLRFQS